MASQLGVFVRRRFRASRKEVFRAFTDPEQLVRWFSPSADIATEVLEHDLRLGGSYRLGFIFPDGERNIVRGAFREIKPPERLAFTWTWEPPDPHAGIETLVTIVLRVDGAETEVVVSHDRFPTNESRDQGLFLSYAFPLVYRGPNAVQAGVKFGLLMGLFLWSSQVIAAAAKHEVSSFAIWFGIETAYFVVQFAIVGLALGLVYRAKMQEA